MLSFDSFGDSCFHNFTKHNFLLFLSLHNFCMTQNEYFKFSIALVSSTDFREFMV